MSTRPKPRDPNRDMSGSGWLKEVTWEDIQKSETGKYTLQEYDFNVTRFTCHNCKTNEHLWLVPQRVGIMLACCGCDMSDGPITMDAGIKVGSAREISANEYVEKLSKRGAYWLVTPEDLRKAERVNPSRPKKRPSVKV